MHKGELGSCMPKNPALRNAHDTLGNIYNNLRVPEGGRDTSEL
jgi:hypothetical protein